MDAPDAAERIARARAIISYRVPNRDPGRQRNELLKKADIKPATYKNWMIQARPGSVPSLDDLVSLALAAGLPRRFAERGFDDLWKFDGEPVSPRHAANALPQPEGALDRPPTDGQPSGEDHRRTQPPG